MEATPAADVLTFSLKQGELCRLDLEAGISPELLRFDKATIEVRNPAYRSPDHWKELTSSRLREMISKEIAAEHSLHLAYSELARRWAMGMSAFSFTLLGMAIGLRPWSRVLGILLLTTISAALFGFHIALFLAKHIFPAAGPLTWPLLALAPNVAVLVIGFVYYNLLGRTHWR